MNQTMLEGLTEQEVDQFEREGWLRIRGLASPEVVAQMREISEEHLRNFVGPLEYEADVGYPLAPESRTSLGGQTVRRLRQAHCRGGAFTEWAQHPGVVQRLRRLLGPNILCSLSHHNCVMTKQPTYSSLTNWHQDVRYWCYQRPELISVWLALGVETAENGGLFVIPGSHRTVFDRDQLDDDLFFREDYAPNQMLLDQKVAVVLEPGDVLFFHCKLLHAAGQNQTDETKYSVVFTYRAEDNLPSPGSKSTQLPDLLIHPSSPRSEFG